MLLSRNFLLKSFSRNYAKTLTGTKRFDILNEVFLSKPETIQWESIRKEMLQNNRNSVNVDSLIIARCLSGVRVDIAKSYSNFLNSKNINFTESYIIQLIRLYTVQYRRNVEEKLTQEQRDEMLGLCKTIINKFDILDPTTAEVIISGLSFTHEWREAEKFFAMTEKFHKLSYSNFISRAIAEGDDKLTWKYLNILAENQTVPKLFVFSEWFKKHELNMEKIEEMLEYIGNNDILLPENELTNISNLLSKSYVCNLVTINHKGKCPSCSNSLPGVKLMQSEFEKLAKRFLEDIIIKSDVFIKSNPKEIERFKAFVEKTIPYDCVIDGCNVAYSQGNKFSPKVYSNILYQVVKHFVDKKQKVLVIGRKYMEKWPKKEINFVKENANLFLAEDL